MTTKDHDARQLESKTHRQHQARLSGMSIRAVGGAQRIQLAREADDFAYQAIAEDRDAIIQHYTRMIK